MLEKVAIFILFLGPLVFFHELGHYFFARLFGVRVEVFSIGFGPKLFKFKRGFTEYAISAIPLGGYVKMFGDDPFNRDSISPAEKSESFIFKGKWARFWIVMGGPLANFVLAWFIFWFLFIAGEKLPEMRIGIVPETSVFYSVGLRSGDVVKKINGTKVFGPTDVVLEEEDFIKTVTVQRWEATHTVTINKAKEDFFKEFVKYTPALRRPIIINPQGQLAALSFDSQKVDWEISYEEILEKSKKMAEIYAFSIKQDKNSPFGYAEDKIFFEKISWDSKTRNISDLNKALSAKNYRSLDLKVQSAQADSPADNAGLKKGDIVWGLNDTPVHSFDQLRQKLQASSQEEIVLNYWRKGENVRTKIKPKIHKEGEKTVKLIGIYSGGEFLNLRFVTTDPLNPFVALPKAFKRTWQTIVKTIDSFRKLLVAEVSLKTIGGPLSIGKVASDSFQTSISYFFQLMALISVNLGVLNLLPIPILDGGHIMFILLELVNRGPISQRKMEIAQQVGLSILLILMLGAIFNDFGRLF